MNTRSFYQSIIYLSINADKLIIKTCMSALSSWEKIVWFHLSAVVALVITLSTYNDFVLPTKTDEFYFECKSTDGIHAVFVS